MRRAKSGAYLTPQGEILIVRNVSSFTIVWYSDKKFQAFDPKNAKFMLDRFEFLGPLGSSLGVVPKRLRKYLRPGSIWVENDFRFTRVVKIHTVTDDMVCLLNYKGQRSWASINRFNGKSKGYSPAGDRFRSPMIYWRTGDPHPTRRKVKK